MNLNPAASTSRPSDAMEGLANRRIRARLGRMVGDHQHAAGLERRNQLAVHLGTIDIQVDRVVVEEQISDYVEVAGNGSS